jgi:hypothetical protein
MRRPYDEHPVGQGGRVDRSHALDLFGLTRAQVRSAPEVPSCGASPTGPSAFVCQCGPVPNSDGNRQKGTLAVWMGLRKQHHVTKSFVFFPL